MIAQSHDVKKYPFRPREDIEEIHGPEVPYLSTIGGLMYLANCTRPDIAFAVNLLARYSSEPIKRHWKGINNIFRYLRGTSDMGLFYSKCSKSLVLQKHDIYLIRTKPDHKVVIYSHVVILQYHDAPESKPLLPPPQTMLKYLRCMK